MDPSIFDKGLPWTIKCSNSDNTERQARDGTVSRRFSLTSRRVRPGNFTDTSVISDDGDGDGDGDGDSGGGGEGDGDDDDDDDAGVNVRVGDMDRDGNGDGDGDGQDEEHTSQTITRDE